MNTTPPHTNAIPVNPGPVAWRQHSGRHVSGGGAERWAANGRFGITSGIPPQLRLAFQSGRGNFRTWSEIPRSLTAQAGRPGYNLTGHFAAIARALRPLK